MQRRVCQADGNTNALLGVSGSTVDGSTSLSSALTGLFAAGGNFRFWYYVDLNSGKLLISPALASSLGSCDNTHKTVSGMQ